ncbi:MAG: EVE domain-containing protein [Planctomycetota bacterium]
MQKPRERRYWLFKSEPSVYGWEHFEKDGLTLWSGVRNYQARNLLRDDVRVGDLVLFYHSNADPTAIVGIARVVAGAKPDPTQFDRTSPYYDDGSTEAAPRWFGVEIAPVVRIDPPLTREQLKAETALADMMLLQRGSRLSVQPVTAAHWNWIRKRSGLAPGI